MLLVIDVGNTNIVLGMYEGETLARSWRVSTDKSKTSDEYAVLVSELFTLGGIRLTDVRAVIISSVVPTMTGVLEGLARSFFGLEPLVVGPGIRTGMKIHYDNPKEVGADRIVNAVAAYEKYHSPLIIVDFGTATTFDYVNGRGEYCGGAIAPGLAISMEALFQKTSKLPRVEFVRPPTVVARNTVSSMQSGIFFGYVGLVDEIVGRMKSECREEVRVVATGGLSGLIAPASKMIEIVEEDLTLEGLRILYQRNREE